MLFVTLQNPSLFLKFAPFFNFLSGFILEISIMRTVAFISMLCLALFCFCTNSPSPTANALTAAQQNPMPPDAAPANVVISDLHCWVERGHFYATGICDNAATEWQKIWLKMEPFDKSGKSIQINGGPDAVFTTFSDAVPPKGRTSFFAAWPLEAFSGVPDSCAVKGAGAELAAPGAILVVLENNGVRMLVPDTIGVDSLISVEKAWHVTAIVQNPLEYQAARPRLELLVYGTDNLLWFATLLNPDDPAQKQLLFAEREGPMEPQEKRRFSVSVTYDNLPQALKDKKIGRVEFQPFNAAE